MGSTPAFQERLAKRLLTGLDAVTPGFPATLWAPAEKLIRDERLFEPRYAYKSWTVAEIGPEMVRLSDGAALPWPAVGAEGVRPVRMVALLCGLGPRLDQSINELFGRRQARLATSIDRLANVALFRLSDWVLDRIAREAERDGLATGEPWEPGQDGFPITEGSRVFHLAEGGAAGFSLSSSGMVGPVRSLSMFVPVGRDMPVWDRSQRCRRCPSRERCARGRTLQ